VVDISFPEVLVPRALAELKVTFPPPVEGPLELDVVETDDDPPFEIDKELLLGTDTYVEMVEDFLLEVISTLVSSLLLRVEWDLYVEVDGTVLVSPPEFVSWLEVTVDWEEDDGPRHGDVTIADVSVTFPE